MSTQSQQEIELIVYIDRGNHARCPWTNGPGTRSLIQPQVRVTEALGGRLDDVPAKGEANTMEFKTNTRSTATAVTQLVTLELVDANGDATPLETEFGYDPKDPFAVTATFMTLAGQVRWTFGRELLIGGLDEPTGDGDVHVWPCMDTHGRPVVMIELCSPDGEALVQGGTAEITSFVESMTALVMLGAEDVDVDVEAAITAIFAAEAA